LDALTHGITARFAVLPSEDARAYAERLDGFMFDFKPRSALERYLIERTVSE
jgi:hypothetical protein